LVPAIGHARGKATCGGAAGCGGRQPGGTGPPG